MVRLNRGKRGQNMARPHGKHMQQSGAGIFYLVYVIFVAAPALSPGYRW